MHPTLKKFGFACAAASALSLAQPAAAQLRVWEDYTPQEQVVELTYVKVDEGQLDTYLEGLKNTWARANEVSMELGQVSSYGIYTVPYGSNEVNLVLRITYPDMAALNASKERYDEFIAAWGRQNMDSANQTVRELYNKIRKIKGTYLLRELKLND